MIEKRWGSSTFDNDNGTLHTQPYGVMHTVQDKDDLLGESKAEYCDNTYQGAETYNTGLIKFQIRQ